MSQSRQDRLLESLLALPGNTTCADCKSPAPRWASVNLGIFICVSCASIHRSLGTHTSRVKSVTMDTWTREMVDRMREMGNARANAVWNPDETRHPPPVSTAEFGERQGEMQRFIRDKYEAGLFRADRPRQPHAPPRPVKEPAGSSSLASRAEPRRQDSWNTLGIPEAREPRRRESAEERATTYGYNGYGGGTIAGGSSGTKRAATRAHVDSNWADFMANEPRPSSGGGGGGGEGRKAGRLLGMGDEYDGEVRLPPVTKAPEGLRYKQDGARAVDKSLATRAPAKESPLPPPPPQPQPTVSAVATAAAPGPASDPAPLINLDATAPMQRSFPQPAPLPSPLPFIQPSTNPFLPHAYAHPQPFHPHAHAHPHPHPHLNPSVHNGGYISASTTPLQEAPFGNPFMAPMGSQMQGSFMPGPATTGMMMGHGNGVGMGMGMGMGGNGYFGGGQPSFGQQGYAYGGWGR